MASSFGSQSIDPVKINERDAAGLAPSGADDEGAKNAVSTPVGTTWIGCLAAPG
jgi:hypothetical protein